MTLQTPPYHEGERQIQERAGERARAEVNGRVIASTIPVAATGFVAQQSMAVLASLSPGGQPWASLLFGTPGFVAAPSPGRLTVDLTRARTHPGDPLARNLSGDPRLGVLLIELLTRRRLRVNGRARVEEGALTVEVEQAYPNCPKYIQRRHLAGPPEPLTGPMADSRTGPALSPEQRLVVRSADTLFVASVHPEHGADASHRGGRAGFVQVLDAATLRIPDYAGNSMFNTLGNVAAHPAAGLLIPDFGGHRTLQLAGEAEIRWDLHDPDGATGGTHRFWDFHVTQVLDLPLPVRVRWETLDASPFNP